MVTVLIFDAVTISWRRVKQTRVLGLVFRRKEKQEGENLIEAGRRSNQCGWGPWEMPQGQVASEGGGWQPLREERQAESSGSAA